jgi:hypothetical protein
MTNEQLITWATVIISVGGAVGVILGIIRPIVKSTKKLIGELNRFTDDWFGSDAEPGRDKVPGVMERLNNIDGELKHNGGSTMKDAVKRIESTGKERDKTLTRIEERLTQIDSRLIDGVNKFSEVDARLNNLESKDK